jgi:hypothetical protein
MFASPEPATPQSSAHRDVYECDFCGRTVYRAVAVEHAEHEDDEPEIVTLCLECVRGVD